MREWTKEQLEEMFGDDVADQLAFLAGCHQHRLSNDKAIPDGWIISDESLRKFAELIVRECADVLVTEMNRLDELNRVVAAQTLDTAQVLIKQHFGVE